MQQSLARWRKPHARKCSSARLPCPSPGSLSSLLVPLSQVLSAFPFHSIQEPFSGKSRHRDLFFSPLPSRESHGVGGSIYWVEDFSSESLCLIPDLSVTLSEIISATSAYCFHWHMVLFYIDIFCKATLNMLRGVWVVFLTQEFLLYCINLISVCCQDRTPLWTGRSVQHLVTVCMLI